SVSKTWRGYFLISHVFIYARYQERGTLFRLLDMKILLFTSQTFFFFLVVHHHHHHHHNNNNSSISSSISSSINISISIIVSSNNSNNSSSSSINVSRILYYTCRGHLKSQSPPGVAAMGLSLS
ncbi:hypothetical protein M441DRAFT_460386, partial [Trichoderma asperellum CBS 433.97]